MDQARVLLPSASNANVFVSENKNLNALTDSAPEGDGFLAHLTQWFSEGSGAHDDVMEAKTQDVSTDSLFKALAMLDSEQASLLGEGGATELAFAEVDGPIADNINNEALSEQAMTLNRELTKHDAEALLQRLEASAKTLQRASHPLPSGAQSIFQNNLEHEGKVLPFQNNDDKLPDEISPVLSSSVFNQALNNEAGRQAITQIQDVIYPSESEIKKTTTLLSQVTKDTGTQANMSELRSEGEASPEIVAKVKEQSDWAGISEKDLLLQASLGSKTIAPLGVDEENDSAITRTLMGQHPIAMNKAASPVNPDTLSGALSGIPWTPLALQSQISSQPRGKAEQLDPLGASSGTDLKSTLLDVKADPFAQQLGLSFGQQSSSTPLRAESSLSQSGLQLTQQQADTANRLSERVNIMLSKNLKHVDIRLDPPELGRLQIKLSMNNDQASVQFTVNNHAAREMIEQSMPRLREMMQQQGVQLAQSSVQHQSSDPQQGSAENQAHSGDNRASQHEASGFRHEEKDQDLEMTTINHELNVNLTKDRVDYYA